MMALVQALAGAGQDGDVLRMLCANACRTLDRRLKDGLDPEDCHGAYPLAAAWLAMDWRASPRCRPGISPCAGRGAGTASRCPGRRLS